MTSGISSTFLVSDIWVNRERRQRRDLTDIDELADSISRVGLIHFPVIRRSGELVVGERRWTAVKSLGWSHIPVQFIEDLSDDELRRVELEENTQRKDILWQDQCAAVAEYHELRSKEPDWSIQKTADALGYKSSSKVRDKLEVAKQLKIDARVAEAPKYSTAANLVQRTKERRASAEKALIVEREEQVEAPILTADFIEWQKTYDGPKFNLIHCDFPYGVGFDKQDGQDTSKDFEKYDDSPDTYYQLLQGLDAAMQNVVDESAHLIFWFSLDFYFETQHYLRDMGWRLDKRLLIWHRSDSAGILPDPNRGPRWVYETAFFASRGDRKIVRAVNNLCPHPTTKTYHMSEKPTGMLSHFMRMICDEYSQVFDPTCGSGNALVSANLCGAAKCCGLERNPSFADGARENWRLNAKHSL